LYACQLAVWEIAEPHVRKNTNKQLQVFIVFFIMFGFKSLLFMSKISPHECGASFFEKIIISIVS